MGGRSQGRRGGEQSPGGRDPGLLSLSTPPPHLWGGFSIPEYSTEIPSSFTSLSLCHTRSVAEGLSQAASASCRNPDYSHHSLLSAGAPCSQAVWSRFCLVWDGRGGFTSLFLTLGPVKQAGEHSKTSKETDRIILGVFFPLNCNMEKPQFSRNVAGFIPCSLQVSAPLRLELSRLL